MAAYTSFARVYDIFMDNVPYEAERAVKTGNGEDSAHREPNLDGLCITTTSML